MSLLIFYKNPFLYFTDVNLHCNSVSGFPNRNLEMLSVTECNNCLCAFTEIYLQCKRNIIYTSVLLCVKGKGKSYPCTGRTSHRGSRGTVLPFHDHGTRRGEWSASRPGRSLPSGKARYPLYSRLDEPQGRSGQMRNISPPPGFDPRTVQPVTSRYTDYATRPTLLCVVSENCANQSDKMYRKGHWGRLVPSSFCGVR